MPQIVSYKVGSKDAQRLIKRGLRPLAELNGELVFQVDEDATAEAVEAPPKPVAKAARRGARSGGVDDSVLVRHRRARRLRLAKRVGAWVLRALAVLVVNGIRAALRSRSGARR